MQADIILVRAVFTFILIAAGYLIRPIPASISGQWGFAGDTGSRLFSAILAALLAGGIIYF